MLFGNYGLPRICTQMLAVTKVQCHREGFSPKRSKLAFTLIELSIVLVIIGLIVGGVLVGRDLIRSAELLKVTSGISSTEAAIQTYKSRYNALPGDHSNAYQMFADSVDTVCGTNAPPGNWSPTDSCNGDGDGLIQNRETIRAFHHLQVAGIANYKLDPSRGDLIAIGASSDDAAKRAQWPNVIIPSFGLPNAGVQMNADYSGCSIGLSIASKTGSGGSYTGDYSGIEALTSTESLMLDTKLDDGMPSTGKFRASGASWGGCGTYVGSHIPSEYTSSKPANLGCSVHWCLIR